MFNFAWPWMLILLPMPWVIRRFFPAATIAETTALKIPFFAALASLYQAPLTEGQPSLLRKYAIYFLWILLIVACARPQWLGEPVQLSRSGRDIMLAMDLSGSMEMPDMNLYGMQATRLATIKTVARQFIQHRVGDRLGLIVFGTHAYLQTPLTFDRDTVRAMLDDATIALAGPNTAIGDAIGLGVKHLNNLLQTSKVLVLLTDGANNNGILNPLQAAKLARNAGIRIYTIGIGSDAATVMGPLGEMIDNPSSDLDVEALQQIASLSGGKFFRANDTQALEQAYRMLDQLEPVQSDISLVRPSIALYAWPLSMALIISLLLALHRLGWLRGFKK